MYGIIRTYHFTLGRPLAFLAIFRAAALLLLLLSPFTAGSAVADQPETTGNDGTQVPWMDWSRISLERSPYER